MSQTHQILQYMKAKPITAKQALIMFGCFRLAARILDLRDGGHNIITTMTARNGKRYAVYTLHGE